MSKRTKGNEDRVAQRINELCDVLDEAAAVAQDIAQIMVDDAPEDEETVMALMAQAHRRLTVDVVKPLTALVGPSGGSVH